MSNYQCPSCGGFCKKSGCERSNTIPRPEKIANENEKKLHMAKHQACEAYQNKITLDDLSAAYGVPLAMQSALKALTQERGQLRAAIELAYGLLWMSSLRGKKAQAAFEALSTALDHEAKGRGIKAAIDAGYEADHPEGCDY